MWKAQPCANLSYYPGIRLQGLIESTKCLSRFSELKLPLVFSHLWCRSFAMLLLLMAKYHEL
jgi:hypothetical protein